MSKQRRGKDGRFIAVSYAYIDSKGYPQITSGPQRGMRIHRIVAAAKMGRPLTKDEDVHHKNGNKLDLSPENLEVLGHKQHGCVSAKQHHYLKDLDVSLKNDWDEWFDAEGAVQ